MSNQMGALAFRAARSPVAGALVRFGFAHADRMLPLTTVRRGRLVAVYEHPRPSYGTWHHLAVPLTGVPDVLALAHPRHAALRAELFAVIGRSPASVLVNAGPLQDVGQVHFHLTDDLMPGREGTVSWDSWDSAVRGLAAAPYVEQRFAEGCSLLARAGDTRVGLV